MASLPHAAPIAARVFAPSQLTIGLSLPVLRTDTHIADFREQVALAQHADALGFRALWVRDVPLNSADYPDPVGHLDPWVLLGALAMHTRRAALISGAIVLTLRHPLHIAKGAVSVSHLALGRFILGLGSGDRPAEYAAFGQDGEARRELYRRHWDTLAAALAPDSRIVPDLASVDAPEFFLLPRPAEPVPMLAVGSGGQSVDWIARRSIGWMTYHREPEAQRARHALWRAAVARNAPDAFRAFGTAMRLQLSDDAHEAATPVSLGYRTGRIALVGMLEAMREAGMHHVTFNLGGERRAREVVDELAAEVLPHFHVD
ncbi:luciferase-type oxidoreductase [Paraburkholderia bannensis]|uniref:Luciferase-type oxidoreductase n=1 Tax=Paraburkholderia bannensis TaxID=765414 RepID=A0A7W9WRE4_9BURK|nr:MULTISPECIES: TIGR03571 family LLM class oxidoreductase [Paraburkholderia]MBB3258097.1 luciferase-type oxidoreductase [Paraburkholderia sp. WP4_3_2]MBB6103110.1 luciferase-type oxidoreductase [Paraburkholderia bannensis]